MLERIAREIAPLRLPAEVERFWRLVDGDSSSFTTYPHPHAVGPETALEIWHEHRQQPGMTPNLLLPVGCESHAFLLVELDGPHGNGGACFAWAYDLSPFELVAADLTSYLDVAAATVEAGHVERHEYDGQVFHTFDDRAFEAALRERLRSQPHPTYGDAWEIECRPASWPSHWLASVGPAAQERDALGATTTLADLADSASGVAGRVHALVDELWGLSEGVRVIIDDGTAAMPVWCPTPVTMFGPAFDGHFYEFELVTTGDGAESTRAEAVAVRLIESQPEPDRQGR